jgi:hypothetical protein
MALSERAAVGLLALLAGCGAPPEAPRVHVRAHWLEHCSPAEDSPSASFDLEALGDFEASPTTSESLDERSNETLVIPADTRAIVVRASSGFDSWHGTAETPPGELAGAVDVALWPEGSECELRSAVDDEYPGPSGGEAMGYATATQTLLIAGGAGTNVEATGALVVRLGTGHVEQPEGLRFRRAFSTLTVFGDKLLLAGGQDPIDQGTVHASAEVFDPVSGQFEPEPIDLYSGRSHHAAVALASGDTLLVGGRGETGALVTFEVVSPATGRYIISGLSQLATARIDPVALVLDDGRVFVAGGTDDDGNPVNSVEWFTADAGDSAGEPVMLPPAYGRAFVPMPGGSVLAVGGCEPAGAGQCAPCPAMGCAERAVFWIAADGSVDNLQNLQQSSAATPWLVAASDGRPWLIAEDASTAAPVLLRFDPWKGEFSPQPDAPVLGAPIRNALALDPGLFAWLEEGSPRRLLGFRHDVRGTFSRDVAPLIVDGPEHLVPDRAANPASDACLSASYDEVRRRLCLFEATAFVSDTTYEDLAVDITVNDGPSPVVNLSGERFGAGRCSWPGSPMPGAVLRLERSGETVTLVVGQNERTCSIRPGRVRVGIESSSGESVFIERLRVRRSVRP